MSESISEYQNNNVNLISNLLEEYTTIKRLLEEEHNQIITNETDYEILTFFNKNPPIELLECVVKELSNYYKWLGETNELIFESNQISFTIDEFFSGGYLKQNLKRKFS